MKNLFKSYRLLGNIGLLIVCILGIIRLQSNRVDAQAKTLTEADYRAQEQAEKLQLDIFNNIPSLGYGNIIADWLYLQFIQYFGDSSARETIGYSLSDEYFLAIAERDPRFVDAFTKLDSAAAIFAGEPQNAVKALEKSLETIPIKLRATVIQPYYLWINKGIDELLFLGDAESAHHSYTMAAKWAEEYNTPESLRTAQRMRGTAKFLEDNPGSKISQIGAWTMVLSSTNDQRTQTRALQEIQALGGEITVAPDGNLNIRVPEGIE